MNQSILKLKAKAQKQLEESYQGLSQCYEQYPESRPIIDIFLKWHLSGKCTIIHTLNGHCFPERQRNNEFFLRGDEFYQPVQFMDRLASFIDHDLFDDGSYSIEWWDFECDEKERVIGGKTFTSRIPKYNTSNGRFVMKKCEPFAKGAEALIKIDYDCGSQDIEELMKLLNWMDSEYDRNSKEMEDILVKVKNRK